MICVQRFLILILCFIGLFENVRLENCENEDSPLLCHGSRVIRSVIDNVITDEYSEKAMKIAPGIEIIKTNHTADLSSAGTNPNNNDLSMYFRRVTNYLTQHEMKIKFNELLNKTDLKNVVDGAFETMHMGRSLFEGRKKDKGGLSMVLMLAVMMKKMLAALGIGAVGALAAKALGVSLLALLLAALIGIKKLADSNHDDGHHVQYVQAQYAHDHHHRRKRSEINEPIPLPYQGWASHFTN